MIPAVWKFFVKSVIVTSVDESTTRPAFCNPINAINKPIPTDTAFLRLSGIASKIASRTFVNESTIKIIPSINTANNATFHEYPISPQTVYAKYALSPRPADKANGRFAIKAIHIVPINDAKHVAIRIASLSMPVPSLKMFGFTAKIYAIVINVVRPAITSVFTEVLFCLSLKIFSNIFLSVQSSDHTFPFFRIYLFVQNTI